MLSGAIGLQIIARRLGVELGEQQFSKISGVDERELTFKEIKRLSSDHSLVCRAIKTDINGLSEAAKKQPVLVHLNNGRYVIVIKLSSEDDEFKEITIIDPKASTPKPEIIAVDKFKTLWDKTGLIFKKSRALEKEAGGVSVGAIFDDVIEDKWLAFQLVLIIIFINIFALAPIVFLIIVLDKVVNYESYSTLYVVASGVVLAHLFNFVLTYYKTSIINLAAAKIEAKYGMQIFRQIINLPVSTFEKQSAQFPTLGQSLNNIRALVINKFLGIITDLVSVLVFTPILILYSPLLGAIVIAFCLVNSLVTALHARRTQNITQEHSHNANERQKMLKSVGDGFIDIKRLGLERDVVEQWKTVEGDFLRSNDKTVASTTFVSEFGTFLNNVLTVVVLFIGVHLVFAGTLSAGVLIGVNMLIGKIFRPTQSLVEFPAEVKNLSQMLENFASAGSLSSENVNAGNFHDVVGAVNFQGVSYGQDQSSPILSDVSFAIGVNETVGICSDNADAASTLAHLLQGLYPPSSGSILVDGNDISTFNLQHLRSNVALVDTTNHFFSGTIRDNFQKVLPNANNDRISWACGITNLQASLDKLNITVESQISDISEIWDDDFRIKLSLARAMIRNPKVLILDDIISHMDPESVLWFKEHFVDLAKSRTVVVISKDLYNLSICKKLIFLSGSKISQIGPTVSLLKDEGPAQELLKKQLKVISPQFEKHYKTLVQGMMS